MMRIAILGATSQIARDLIISFSNTQNKYLHLFARRPYEVEKWLASIGLVNRYPADDFSKFSGQKFDAVINFVGSGNPAQTLVMGSTILDVTQEYDTLALNYLHQHPKCRYLFLSSGAAYGGSFDGPVDAKSKAVFAINNFKPQDWYGVAKLYAECRHRSLSHLPIVDIRVFSYFSHTQDISARFFITEILRAIQSGETLITSSDNIVRDYIGPAEFHQLVSLILAAAPVNDVIDCYTKAPVDKMTLLTSMKDQFGLKFKIKAAHEGVNATGLKMNYFSNYWQAEKFGYLPTKTSLNIVLDETRLGLGIQLNH